MKSIIIQDVSSLHGNHAAF